MKKVIFTLIILTGLAGTAMAQDCEAIVGPFFTLNGIDPDNYPTDKYAYRCLFSQNSFFLTDQAPEGSTIYNLSELTDLLTGLKVPENFVINIDFKSFRKSFCDKPCIILRAAVYLKSVSLIDKSYPFHYSLSPLTSLKNFMYLSTITSHAKLLRT